MFPVLCYLIYSHTYRATNTVFFVLYIKMLKKSQQSILFCSVRQGRMSGGRMRTLAQQMSLMLQIWQDSTYVHQLDTATCMFGQLTLCHNSQIPIQQFILSSETMAYWPVSQTMTAAKETARCALYTILSINEKGQELNSDSWMRDALCCHVRLLSFWFDEAQELFFFCLLWDTEDCRCYSEYAVPF